jgi:hypothetical protein
LGEHRELHGLWNILTLGKKGYSRHPETLRWVGKLKALYKRHGALVKEMSARGYEHHSDLKARYAAGSARQTRFIDAPREQLKILRRKKCPCPL